MELNLDIAVMFFVISSALFYYLDPGQRPQPRPRPPGQALDPLGPLFEPLAPCPRPRLPGYTLAPGRALAPLAAPMAHCRPSNVKLHLSTSTWSPSWLSLPSTSRGLLQPRPRPLCGWPPNERLRDTERVTVTEYDQYIDIQQQKTYQGG